MILTWHVDYWDYLGWKDPLGSKEASDRQSRYAKAREQTKRWTPQFVVDGEIVPGRQAGGIPDRVKDAHAAEAPISIDAEATLADGKIAVAIRLRETEGDWDPKATLRVTPVLVRSSVETEIPKGENAGKTLTEHFVAVAVGKAIPIADALGEDGAAAALDAPAGVNAKDLSVAVLVENPADMRIIQCASIAVTEPAAEPTER